MTKQEFLDRMAREQPDLGETEIETEYLTESPYVLGCYYDESLRKWRTYETFERGGYSIIHEYDNEEEAFDVFYKLVQWEAEATALAAETRAPYPGR